MHTWWFYTRPRKSLRQPKRFSPLGLRESNLPSKLIQEHLSKVVEDIRDLAVTDGNPESLAVFLGFMLFNPSDMFEKPHVAPTQIHGMGQIEEEVGEDQLKVNKSVLSQQFKDAFEISEERLSELVVLGRKVCFEQEKYSQLRVLWEAAEELK